MSMEQLPTPKQKFFPGDLVAVTKDDPPYLAKGMTGIITLARCDKVCVKGGIKGFPVSSGGPVFAMEWCYVGRFGNDRPQGVRISRLSPVEVIS